ncbi:MAG: indole-3-glycerol phosphate synthase, partial [Capnocytophaga sp.]
MDILLQIKQQRDLQLQRELASVERPSFFKALAQEGIRIIGEIK